MAKVVKHSWGTSEVILEVPGLKIKRLRFQAHQKMSYQKHKHRNEFWIIFAGELEMTMGVAGTDLYPGDVVHIPCEQWHTVETYTACEIFEVQYGEYCGEDDIERK